MHICSIFAKQKTNTQRLIQMKKYFYFIFLTLTLLGLSSCNSDGEEPTGPKVIENPKEDDLIGTWEVYYSAKQVTGEGVNTPVFRTIDYDGFINKFYKGQNGEYIFENLNLLDQIVDKGTYKIENGTIIMDVTKHNGKDTVFQNIETIGLLLDNKETLSVFKYFTIDKYAIKDNRVMRNLERAPKVHPNVEKIDVETRFNEIIGTWEIYDYVLLVNGEYKDDAQKYSKLKLDSIKGNTYTFAYDSQGKKKLSLKVKGWDSSGNLFWDETSYTNLEVKVVDDVIYYIVPDQYNEKTGTYGPQAFWLWVTDWKTRKDPETGLDINSFIDRNQFRTDAKPEIYYTEQRFFKKIK